MGFIVKTTDLGNLGQDHTILTAVVGCSLFATNATVIRSYIQRSIHHKKGCLSVAMLNYQRVNLQFEHGQPLISCKRFKFKFSWLRQKDTICTKMRISELFETTQFTSHVSSIQSVLVNISITGCSYPTRPLASEVLRCNVGEGDLVELISWILGKDTWEPRSWSSTSLTF